jgi:hypothetical protein
MKKILALLLSIFLASCTTKNDLKQVDKIPDNIKTLRAVIPIFSQRISIQLPTTWKPAHEDQNSSSYLIEFIPKNESIEAWQNLVSVQGFKNLSFNANPEEFIDRISDGFKRDCEKDVVYTKLGASKIDGYPSYSAILGCANSKKSEINGLQKGKSEIGYFLAIKGESDLYVIYKSIRGDAFDAKKPPINSQNIGNFIVEIKPIELCKKGGHPAECKK